MCVHMCACECSSCFSNGLGDSASICCNFKERAIAVGWVESVHVYVLGWVVEACGTHESSKFRS